MPVKLVVPLPGPWVFVGGRRRHSGGGVAWMVRLVGGAVVWVVAFVLVIGATAVWLLLVQTASGVVWLKDFVVYYRRVRRGDE